MTTQFGNYRFVEQIAEGGFGKTFKAEHIELGTPVCIKHSKKISPKAKRTLFEEAKTIWDLRHFGIPVVRDVIEMDDGSVAMVMSYISGPTISEIRYNKHYKKDGIDPIHVAWIIDRLLNILKYLHFNGVVHGDIKPQNVIVQPRDHTIVLVDYGLSTVNPDENTKTKGYTKFFASPEQMNRKPPIPESDFYSLGMLMIYMLGGDVEKINVPAKTPSAMCEFIKSLIRIDPFARPTWQKEDLCSTISDVRTRDFGSDRSNMAPLKIED